MDVKAYASISNKRDGSDFPALAPLDGTTPEDCLLSEQVMDAVF
jgi:hypothetical protein